jgi:hypothetical protein
VNYRKYGTQERQSAEVAWKEVLKIISIKMPMKKDDRKLKE